MSNRYGVNTVRVPSIAQDRNFIYTYSDKKLDEQLKSEPGSDPERLIADIDLHNTREHQHIRCCTAAAAASRLSQDDLCLHSADEVLV